MVISLLVKNKQVADKFLSAKELTGLCKIKCTLHETLNLTKGTIYAPYLNKIPEEEIVKELNAQGVVSAFKFPKIVDGKSNPSGVVLLSFDLYKLPEKLIFLGIQLKYASIYLTPCAVVIANYWDILRSAAKCISMY